jgi:hypothetical protein
MELKVKATLTLILVSGIFALLAYLAPAISLFFGVQS